MNDLLAMVTRIMKRQAELLFKIKSQDSPSPGLPIHTDEWSYVVLNIAFPGQLLPAPPSLFLLTSDPAAAQLMRLLLGFAIQKVDTALQGEDRS